MKKIIFFIVFVGLLSFALAQQSYRVKPGDNLLKIAKKYGLKVQDLEKANNIRNTRMRLRPGTKIIIPQHGGGAELNQEYFIFDLRYLFWQDLSSQGNSFNLQADILPVDIELTDSLILKPIAYGLANFDNSQEMIGSFQENGVNLELGLGARLQFPTYYWQLKLGWHFLDVSQTNLAGFTNNSVFKGIGAEIKYFNFARRRAKKDWLTGLIFTTQGVYSFVKNKPLANWQYNPLSTNFYANYLAQGVCLSVLDWYWSEKFFLALDPNLRITEFGFNQGQKIKIFYQTGIIIRSYYLANELFQIDVGFLSGAYRNGLQRGYIQASLNFGDLEKIVKAIN